MATAYIREYREAYVQQGSSIQIANEPAITDQTVSFTGTAGTSAAFNANTKFVRIQTDGICSFLFGASPTALTTSARLAAGTTEYFGVIPGQKVSFITNT